MTVDTKQEIQMSTKDTLLNDVSKNLQELLVKNAAAFPKDFNQTRFLQNCLTVLGDTKSIEKCTPISIAKTMIKGAYLGLDFFRRECYAIPYEKYENSKPTGIYELNFQTDYKGEIKLVNQHSVEKVKDIYAKIVREGDDLEISVRDGQQYVNFKPLPFNDGKIIGAFAVALFHSGAMICDQMSLVQLEKTRTDYSKVPNGPAYQKSIGEMYKKIVLRRVCKLVSLAFDSHEQEAAHQEGSDGLIPEIKTVIDASAEEVIDPFKKKPETNAASPVAVLPVSKEPFNEDKCRQELKEKHPEYHDNYINFLVSEEKKKW